MHATTLAAFLAVFPLSTAAQSPGALDSAEVRRWREDLAVLRTEMPARHANLFHAMTRAQFDSALSSIDRRLPLIARHQVIVELQRLDALVGDGHSSVGPWRDTATVFHELPVSLYWFADGIHVRAATVANASLVGARVIAIGGVPIDSAVARVQPLVHRDNEMGIRAWAPLFLVMPEILHAVGLAPNPRSAAFTVETSGVRRQVTLAAVGLFPMLTGETDLTWRQRDGWVDARGKTRPVHSAWCSTCASTAAATVIGTRRFCAV